MILQIASAEYLTASRPPTPVSVPAAAMAANDTDETPAHALAAPSPQFSTDLRVDDQHQVYYACVDESTGDVLFEIPPEALRAIGESLNLPLNGDASAHSVDVKS